MPLNNANTRQLKWMKKKLISGGLTCYIYSPLALDTTMKTSLIV